LTEIHDGDAIAGIGHGRQVVSDEQVGKVEPLLKLLEKVQHLSLDRDVERRDRLVADDERRIQNQGAGDGDALALAAAERMGVAVEVIDVEAATSRSPSASGSRPATRK
jgi:hypothetical protein